MLLLVNSCGSAPAVRFAVDGLMVAARALVARERPHAHHDLDVLARVGRAHLR